jgi:hypothetical protein
MPASTPLEAAKRYMLATLGSDRQVLRDTIAGKTPLEERAADVWADSVSAQRRVATLIRQRFGAEGYQAFYGRPPQPQPDPKQAAAQINEVIKSATIEVAGNQARIRPSQAPGEPLWLTRRDGQWRVWIAPILRSRTPELLENYVKLNHYYGPMYRAVADAIESGTAKDAAAAQEVMNRIEAEQDRIDIASAPTLKPEDLEAETEKLRAQEAERNRIEREANSAPLVPSGDEKPEPHDVPKN